MSHVALMGKGIIFVATLSTLVVLTACLELPKIMGFHVDFINAFYPIKKSIVAEAIRNRLNADKSFGADINFTVPKATDHFDHFNNSEDSIIMVQTIHFQSPELAEDVPCPVREEYSTSYFAFGVYVPFLKVESVNIEIVTLQLAFVTKGPQKVMYPFFHQDVTYVDDIIFSEQQATLKNGDDVMTIDLETSKACRHKFPRTASDMSSVRDHIWSSFPAEFDLKFCDSSNWSPSVCQIMRENESELRNQNDVCVSLTVDSSTFCDATMSITESSGIFAELPLMAELVGTQKRKGVWGRGDRDVSIILPCLTN